MLALAPVCAAWADTPQLAIAGGSGNPGDTVAVIVRLAGDAAGAGVSADIDMRFPTDLVEFIGPVGEHCRVADRLAATHQIGGTVIRPGVLSLALFVRNLQVNPLGDGDLATCDFHILPGAALGAAPLTIDFVGLGSATGAELPVTGVPGAIGIGVVPPLCVGDCNGDLTVTIDEIIRGVRIALDELTVDACPAFDRDGDGRVSVSEITDGVNASLTACPGVVTSPS
jgi:hypothetical protein